MGDRFYFLIFICFMLLTTLIIIQYSFESGQFRTKCIDAGGIPSRYRITKSKEYVCFSPTAVLEIK